MTDDSTPDPTDILAALPDLIGTDESLRDLLNTRVSELIEAAFDQVEDILVTGDPKSREAIIKSLIPQMIRVKNQGESMTSEMAKAKAEVMRVFAEMGAGFGDAGVGGDDEEDDDDEA